MNRTRLSLQIIILCGLASSGFAQSAQPLPPCAFNNVTMTVELLSPLTTKTARPGDAFLVNVTSPDQLADAKIEGDIKSMVKAERGIGKGKPHIELEFSTLTMNGRSCRLTADLQEVRNSKGVAHVDDEGSAIGHTSNKKRIAGTLGGALLGSLVGYAASGGSGAATGAAVGGMAGLLLTSKLTTTGTDITFQPKSVFILQASGTRTQGR
jgi:hypothetical protein